MSLFLQSGSSHVWKGWLLISSYVGATLGIESEGASQSPRSYQSNKWSPNGPDEIVGLDRMPPVICDLSRSYS